MLRIVYHGPDESGFAKLQQAAGEERQVVWLRDRTGLRALLERWKPHALVLPIRSPGPDDLRYLRVILEKPRAPAVVVIAEGFTVSQAVSCMRLGAFDFFCEPVSPIILARCFDALYRSIFPGRGRSLDRLIGDGRAISEAKQRIHRYADSPLPVHIEGETGTGKDLAARILHEESARRMGPFISVNCGGVPTDLLCSELFGTRTGAFTGSVDRAGRFEEASKGTLFLDEIGELSPSGQVTLLRVLEDHVVTRLGGHLEKHVDVRIVTATSKNLKSLAAAGRFREELLYRIRVLSLSMPPLRKRREDIPALAGYFLAEENPSYQRIDGAAMYRLVRYPWPGNVRELRSVMLRAAMNPGPVIRSGDIDFA